MRRESLKFRPFAADSEWSVFRGSLAVVVAGLLVSGCGAASSADGGSDGQPGSAEAAQTLVQSMVLKDGDLPGFHLQDTKLETLKEQMPPKGARGYAQAKRLVAANWIASAHSVVVRDDGSVPLFTDANLFRTAAAATSIWKLETATAPPGYAVRSYPAHGAPPGARLRWITSDKRAAFQLDWRQGRVIGIVILFGHPHEKLTRVGIQRVTAFMARAATKQSSKITNLSAAYL